MVFANPGTGHYFDSSATTTQHRPSRRDAVHDQLAVRRGHVLNGRTLRSQRGGARVIYQIEAVAPPTAAVSIGTHSLTAAATRVHQGMGDLSWTKTRQERSYQHRPPAS